MKLFIFGLLIITATVFANDNDPDEQPKTIVLESNFIGDKEQPSVSYFIPWEGIGTPDKLQWHISDKVDRTLDLIDRKVMRRSTTIYKELNLEQNIVVNQEK